MEVALHIARKAFYDKVDKAGRPYIEHAIRVSERCPPGGYGDPIKVIALLHDILEDCPEWTAKSLATFFDDAVVNSVIALTHVDGETYDEYIDRVLKDSWATTVKQYDLEDNMDISRLTEVTDGDLVRLKKYHQAYRRIVDALSP